MKLSYMTWVCPDWEIEKVVRFANETEYDGVELRVDTKHAHQVSSESSGEKRKYVKTLFDHANVEVSSIATSILFSSPKPEIRKKSIEDAKANMNLAADLGAGVVRLFAGKEIPILTDESADYIAAAFDEVGDYAKASGVCPVLESEHDIIKTAEEAAEIVKRVNTSNFGVLWNHSGMDARTFDLLKDHVRHFHLHDEVLEPDNDNILHLARLMKGINYSGYISLEIIRGHTLAEDLLIDTAKRLKGYVAQAYQEAN